MKLLILGSTGYHPNNRRHTACLMLPELGIVLDAGTAMFRVRDHLQTDTLDVFLSHAHVDHVVGLTFVFDVIRDKQVEHIVVHGEADKIAAVQENLFAQLLFPIKPPLVYRELTDCDLPSGGRLTHFPLKHPGGAVGYRLDWPDRSMAYVTDTTARRDADYLDKIRGVDLLIHECYFPDGFEELAELTGHTCTTPVAELARAADVGRLVLVHVNPTDESDDPIQLDAAQAIFPATEIAYDEMQIDF